MTGKFLRQDVEADDAALRLLCRAVVQVVAVDSFENHLPVTRVSFNQLVGLLVRQQETVTQKDRALINVVGILR